jgi:hypothetical protein
MNSRLTGSILRHGKAGEKRPLLVSEAVLVIIFLHVPNLLQN